MVWKEILVACWRIVGGKTVDRASGLRGVMCRRLHPGMKIMDFLEEHIQAMLANILPLVNDRFSLNISIASFC